MKIRVVLFILGYVIWVILNWVPDWQHLLVGIFVTWFVAFLTADLFPKSPQIFKKPERYFYFVCYYTPVFLYECLKANLDVAYRVLHPQKPLNPGIVKVQTKLKSEMGMTFLANSITLTPGTLSVDIDKKNGILYIHWIDVKATDVKTASKIIVEPFESILLRIFE